MKLKLHHINLSSNNVKKMNYFYKNILLLDTETNDLPILERRKGYSGDVEFVTDGNIQTHLAEKDLEVNFKTGHSINPLERGHIAYRTDDLEKFKNHLKSKGIKYSDWGETAVAGWKQIFFYDPDGNIIEVHEKEVS
ncbi:MAG: VOC family protein [Alphaproteobacteria bacterium]|nr:MAG: VOC family protein [Alphaproteobacteria bacterium]